MHMTAHDRSDGDAELVLTSAGVSFEYATIPLSEIDWLESERNRGRSDPTNQETIDEYAAEMARGSVFPAICVRKIVRPGRKTSYAILGGVHRCKAKLKNNESTTLAIVVTTDSAQAEAIAGRLNAVMGRRTTNDERMNQAIELVRKRQWSQTDAADYLSIDRKTLGMRLQSLEAREYLEAKGVPVSSVKSISNDKLRRIAGIESKPLKLAAAQLAIAGNRNLGTAEFKRIVNDAIRADTTEQERIDILTEEAKQWQRKKKAPASMLRKGAATEIRSIIRTCESVVRKHPTPAATMLSDQDAAELRKLWNECSAKILTILAGSTT